MISRHLGHLVQDHDIEEWWVSAPVQVPLLREEVEFVLVAFTLDDRADEFEDAISAFLALDTADREQATPYVYENYRRFIDAVGADELEYEIATPEGVWDHVQAGQIYVQRRHRRDKEVYVQITARCDWEIEHGLQLVYRRGSQLTRVSAQDGHLTHADAYDLPEDQDQIS